MLHMMSHSVSELSTVVLVNIVGSSTNEPRSTVPLMNLVNYEYGVGISLQSWCCSELALGM